MKLIKQKACFLIFLIAFTTFTIYTPTAKAQNKECCERTKSGSFCSYTDASECDSSFKNSPALCEDTSYCTLGCCFDSSSGECFLNSAQSECSQLGGTWEESPTCDIAQCQVGCCQLNNQAFMSTLIKCKQVASQFPNTEPNFDASIQDEYSCVNSVRSGELGCCAQAEGQCAFTTREQCGLEDPTISGDEKTTEAAFYANTLCSSDKLACNAAKQHHLGCYNEDVYWFDSENNPENVFIGNSEEAKRRSYNSGRILNEDLCEASPNDPNCGNCDYTKGTLCAEENGEFICKDLTCKDTEKFDFSPDAKGGSKDLGESWCIFDGPVGFARDRVGSRHFRSSCVNGEEIIEPCADFREEFCTQSFSNGQATTNFGSFFRSATQIFPQLEGSSPLANIFSSDRDYSEAACRQNRFGSCAECNTFSSTIDIQECCNEIAYRDCFFLPAGLTNAGGVCVPNVPPGLRFWSEDTSALARQTTNSNEQTVIDRAPTAPGDDTCSAANQECEVGFTRGGIDKVLGKSNWECTYNCHCLKEETFGAAHAVCQALGDCGAYFNYEGVLTDRGFDVKVSGPEGQELKIPDKLRLRMRSDLKDDLIGGGLAKAPKEGGGPDKPTAGDFFKSSALPLSVIAITSLIGFVNTGTLQGLVAGFALGPLTLLSGITAPFQYIAGSGGFTQSLGRSLSGLGTQESGKLAFTEAATVKVGSTITQNTVLTAEGAIAQGLVQKTATEQGVKYALTEAGQEAAKAGTIEFAASQGTVKVLAKDGIKATADVATTTTTATALGATLGVINAVMWVWTVLELVDWLAADTRTGKVEFVCKSWEAPSGGADCDKCNDGPLPCSEYRCKSLGKSCAIVNEGTGNELCSNIFPGDASSPRIDADTEVMTLQIQKESFGFTVLEKIPPFTPVELALRADEPAQCKFSVDPGIEFDEMNFDFGSSLYLLKHKMTFSLPSELTQGQALTLTNGGKYTVYVRCQDANGNKMRRDFYIKFEIGKGPDLTPPKIEQTSIKTGSFIAANLDEVPISVFVNEPASCKWDKRDIDYDQMENSLSCISSGFDVSLANTISYQCTASLPLETAPANSTKRNAFFFRCKDQAGNENRESFPFALTSTTSLQITETGPSGVLRTGSNIELKVKTSGGAENGKAVCGAAQQDLDFTLMPAFQNTNSNIHSQTLQPLEEGTYKFFVTCLDIGGNEVKSNIEFTIEADTIPPILLFVYKDTSLGILHIEVNEATSCRYAETEFSWERGIPMTNENSMDHEATLGNNLYIIKCRDEFNNEATFRVVP